MAILLRILCFFQQHLHLRGKALSSSALCQRDQKSLLQTGPEHIGNWVAEEELELWEIRAFLPKGMKIGHGDQLLKILLLQNLRNGFMNSLFSMSHFDPTF